MKVIKTKLEAIKVKSFVTTIEQEKTITMKGGSSHDTLPENNGCYLDSVYLSSTTYTFM